MAEERKTFLERHLGLAVALVGIVSGLLSAYATHSLTMRRELVKSRHELRVKAYASFLEGQSLYQEDASSREGNRLIRQAKLNILLSGAPEVICAMASYWASSPAFPTCDDAAEKRSDAALYQAMRREVFRSLDLEDPSLDTAVVVAYLRDCLLPGTDRARLCSRP